MTGNSKRRQLTKAKQHEQTSEMFRSFGDKWGFPKICKKIQL